jgi:hypothetical protein
MTRHEFAPCDHCGGTDRDCEGCGGTLDGMQIVDVCAECEAEHVWCGVCGAYSCGCGECGCGGEEE